MLTLPPNIRINMGTQQPSGVVAHCHQPDCEWSWVWEPQTEHGVPDDEINAITRDHYNQQHAYQVTHQ